MANPTSRARHLRAAPLVTRRLLLPRLVTPRLPTPRPPAPGLLAAATFAALLAGLPADTRAQVGAAVELRAGGSIGQYDAARSELNRDPRPAWRLGVTVSPRPYLHLVGSYGQAGFGCVDGFCTGSDVAFRSAGAELGVRLGASLSRRGPWVQAELVGHTLHARWTADTEQSDRALGWGAAAGYHLPLRPGLALSPAIRVQTYQAALAPDPDTHRISLATAELGLRVRLR
jgi:hypothetical protein